MRATIKWIASSLGMSAKLFASHSLRAGGASTLFANGGPLEEIKRFGRWASDTFHIYLYGDSLNLRDLSYALCGDNHLLEQVRAADEHRINHMPGRRKIRKIDREQGDFSHCVGGMTGERDDESDQATRSEHSTPRTKNSTAFDEQLMQGLVDPKLEEDESDDEPNWVKEMQRSQVLAEKKEEAGHGRTKSRSKSEEKKTEKKECKSETSGDATAQSGSTSERPREDQLFSESPDCASTVCV